MTQKSWYDSFLIDTRLNFPYTFFLKIQLLSLYYGTSGCHKIKKIHQGL